jgi:hypothetical protein
MLFENRICLFFVLGLASCIGLQNLNTEHTEEEERQEERYNRVRQRLFGFTSG